MPVKAVEAILRGGPDEAAFILGNAPDVVAAQAFGLGELYDIDWLRLCMYISRNKQANKNRYNMTPPYSPHNNWLIVLLIYADYIDDDTASVDEKVSRQMDQVFRDLYHCKIRDGVRLYVIINSVKYAEGGGIEDKTIVSEVLPNVPVNSFRTVSVETAKLDTVASVSGLFKKVHSDAGDFDHLFLITWDHGSVFGIFKEKIEELGPNKNEVFTAALVRAAPTSGRRPNRPHTDRFMTELGVGNWQNSLIGRQAGKESLRLGSLRFYLPSGASAAVLERYFANQKSIQEKANTNSPSSCELLSQEFRLAESGGGKLLTLIENWHDTRTDAFESRETEVSEFQEEGWKILTNEELADAITIGFSGKKVDVLMMMNCWMANLHTADALQKQVKYLVAPQTVIDEPGYDCQRIISAITSQTRPYEIISNCRMSLEKPYPWKYTDDQIAEISTWAVIFLNLERYSDNCISTSFNTIAKHCADLMDIPDCRFLLKSARRHCYLLSEINTIYYDLVDFKNWLESIVANKMGEFDDQIASPLFSDILLHKDVISQYCEANPKPYLGENIYYEDLRNIGKVTSKTLSGLSIYFPEVADPLNDKWLKAMVKSSALSNDCSQWAKLLKRWQNGN